jgi:hypothetical protein
MDTLGLARLLKGWPALAVLCNEEGLGRVGGPVAQLEELPPLAEDQCKDLLPTVQNQVPEAGPIHVLLWAAVLLHLEAKIMPYIFVHCEIKRKIIFLGISRLVGEVVAGGTTYCLGPADRGLQDR